MTKTTLTTLPSKAEKTLRPGQNKLRVAGRSFKSEIDRMLPGVQYGDPDHPGLRCRCVDGKPPQKIFFYRYHNPEGKLRQVEIGVYGPMTLVDARSRWQELQAIVRNGGDPRAEQKAERAKAAEVAAELAVATQEAEKAAITVGDVFKRYLDECIDKKRKAKGADEARRIVNQFIRFETWTKEQRAKPKPGRVRSILPDIVRDVAHLPAEEFTRQKAHELLVEFGKGTPRSGAMVRALLRAAWRHAIDNQIVNGPHPFEHHGKGDDTFGGAIVQNDPRDRMLSKEEVGQLLRWMSEPGTYSRTVRDVLELVLRTGLRSGEVCGIHTSELSWRDGVLWLEIPGRRMKGKQAHLVPLMGTAAQIVDQRWPEKGGFLFPSVKHPDRPIEQKVVGVDVYACSGRSKAETYKYRRICPVSGWAPHDLRRTARSLLAQLGCPVEVAETILAHKLPGVIGVYNRHDYAREKVEWLSRLGALLDDAKAAQGRISLAKVAA